MLFKLICSNQDPNKLYTSNWVSMLLKSLSNEDSGLLQQFLPSSHSSLPAHTPPIGYVSAA